MQLVQGVPPEHFTLREWHVMHLTRYLAVNDASEVLWDVAYAIGFVYCFCMGTGERPVMEEGFRRCLGVVSILFPDERHFSS
jgi:hypothetical protein